MPDEAVRILIADDEPATRDALERLLAWDGYAVVTAASGLDALRAYARSPPHVVVSDLCMPTMDGFELVRRLKAQDPDLPIIVVSAIDEIASAVTALRSGADDYLTKPVDADALKFAIERARSAGALRREARELRARNDALRVEAERNLAAREELLGIVAHDLRSYLSGIILSASALRRKSAAKADVEAVAGVDAILRASARAGSLVTDLLDAERIERGALPLDIATVASADLLAQVTEATSVIAAAKGVNVRWLPAPAFAIECDGARIVQVLINLVTNAIEVADRGSTVTLDAAKRDGSVVIRVEDDGPGISDELLPHIFDRFRRGQRGRRGGFGLGLAIAKGIVEAHGGTISAAHRETAGARFELILPAEVPSRASWSMSIDSPSNP